MIPSADTDIKEKTKALYDKDLHLWIEQTIHQLQNREFNKLDIEHLIKELTDLGKSDQTWFVSNLKILLAHLLKLKVQHDAPYMMKGSWYNSVDEHRERIADTLSDNPSFKSFLTEAIEKAYPKSRKLAIKESQRAKFGVRVTSKSEYPITCPFTIDEILDENFYGKGKS